MDQGGGRGEGSVGGNREAGGGWGPARGRDTLSQSVEVPVCYGKGERGKLPDISRKVEREREPKLRWW